MFLRQYPCNQTIAPSKVVGMPFISGQPWSQGSLISQIPVLHLLRLAVEVAESSWGCYLRRPVQAGIHESQGTARIESGRCRVNEREPAWAMIA